MSNTLTMGGPIRIPIPPKNIVIPKMRFKFSLPKRARGTRAKKQVAKSSVYVSTSIRKGKITKQ